MKKSQNKIAKLFKDAEEKATSELNNQVRASLLEIKMKNKYDSVEIYSGMGTWIFKINGKSTDTDKRFIKLDEFLRLMAGTHNIYAYDITV
jgi:hypothetical protein